jgi:hypothetical protein
MGSKFFFWRKHAWIKTDSMVFSAKARSKFSNHFSVGQSFCFFFFRKRRGESLG